MHENMRNRTETLVNLKENPIDSHLVPLNDVINMAALRDHFAQ